MRIVSLFSGIGAFEKSFKRQGYKHEVVAFSEIDKWAIESYSAIHGISKDKNLGDVSKIKSEEIPDAELVTYGFPCQDISIAGKGKGIVHGETRSGLLYEAMRVIEDKRPRYAIAENVKNLTSKRFKEDFEAMLKELEELGYNNYWQVLNASEHGIPQARERVFIVSIRKDIDQGMFEFEKPQELKLRFIDLLDKEVEEKYYIDNERVSELLQTIEEKELHKLEHDKIKQGGSRQPMVVCAMRGRYNEDGKVEQQIEIQKKPVSNTITTVTKDNLIIDKKVKVREATKKGYDIAEVGDSINISFPKSKTRRGRVGKEVAQTLDTSCEQATLTEDYRLRKITPLECWRLMGFTDEDYWKARRALEKEFYNGNDRSNSQMYKQAGNSIVVDVLDGIIKKIMENEEIVNG